MKHKRGSTHDRMFEEAHLGKGKNKPSQKRKQSRTAAARAGSVRASMPKKSPSRSKTESVTIGRDTRTGQFVSLKDVPKNKSAKVEKFKRKKRG